MRDARQPAVTPRPAATVLLVRDSARGIEVFLVERHAKIDFAGGATAFPGGKVHPSDGAPELRARCRGAEALDEDALALRVAAIRECFEECGFLLARTRGGEELVPALRLADLWKRWRAEVRAHHVAMAELAQEEDLELATDLLVPFAHWITPEGLPKRFDTHFFLTPAPPEQIAAHDGRELVGARWLTPAQALADADAKRRSIMIPTRMNLAKLGRHASVSEAVEAARTSRIVTVLPRLPPEQLP
jgi:8-oxo-dGTP pyrophosphatase MutT (NUDIX family)